MRHCLSVALLAGALGLVFAAPAANAQDYGPYGPPGYQNGPPEEVTVIAPRYRAEATRLNGPAESLSLSVPVSYNDLDLLTGQGAHALRTRVRDAARDVCGQLADAFPLHKANGTSCFKTAYENAIVRANAAITDARLNARAEEY
jgi:UrcA family protein